MVVEFEPSGPLEDKTEIAVALESDQALPLEPPALDASVLAPLVVEVSEVLKSTVTRHDSWSYKGLPSRMVLFATSRRGR